ncbi:MAG: hypothetical protein RIC56_15200 [Pseudomonadales bacterium]
MSRSFLGFLGFCLLLALVTAGVVWYMGPALAAIVVDGERRENPYYLLQMLPRAAVVGDNADPSYRARFVTLAAEDDARLLWQGGAADVAEGSILLDVAGAQLLEFASGADLVQMFTSSAYRALDSAVGTLPVRQVGSATEPLPLAPDRATVIVFYRADEGAGALPLGRAGEGGWLRLLPDYGGDVRWDAEVDVIRSGGNWSRVLLLQFVDVAAAASWLADPATVTERAIAAKNVDALTAIIVQPGAPRL